MAADRGEALPFHGMLVNHIVTGISFFSVISAVIFVLRKQRDVDKNVHKVYLEFRCHIKQELWTVPPASSSVPR